MASFLFRSRATTAAAAVALTSAAYLSTQHYAPAQTTEKKPLPQLKYFNIVYGLAFPIRAALNHGNVPFEDIRFTEGEFQKLKEQGPTALPLGQAPVLVLPDGKVACQSNAILRWAGKQSGLYPTDLEKALLVDEVLDSAAELTNKIPQNKDAAERKRLREEYLANDFAKLMRYFTLRLEQSKGPFILGNELSIADLRLARQIAYLNSGLVDYINGEHVKQYPAVWKHYHDTCTHPTYASQVEREKKK